MSKGDCIQDIEWYRGVRECLSKLTAQEQLEYRESLTRISGSLETLHDPEAVSAETISRHPAND